MICPKSMNYTHYICSSLCCTIIESFCSVEIITTSRTKLLQLSQDGKHVIGYVRKLH